MASYVGTEPYPGIAHVPVLNDILLTYLYLLTGDASVAALSVLPGVMAVGGALVMGILAFQSTVNQKTSYLFWFILAGLPVIGLFVLSHMAGIRYQDRYFTVALPAVILIFLLGCAKLPRSVGLLAFSIVLFTGTYQSVQQSVVGDNSRTDWTGASAYIEDHMLMTDQVVFQRWTTYQAFIDHFPENSLAVADVVLFEELPTGVTLELDARRMWVIYRAPKQDFHAQEWLSDFDPFLPALSPLSDWLIEHQAQVVDSKRFKGVTVLLLAPYYATSFEFSMRHPILNELARNHHQREDDEPVNTDPDLDRARVAGESRINAGIRGAVRLQAVAVRQQIVRHINALQPEATALTGREIAFAKRLAIDFIAALA